METLTQLFICTPWRAQAHKWDVDEEGLVMYRDQRVTPRFVVENFESDYPMFRMIRAEVCRREVNPDPEAERPYMWITLERFDLEV